jgi:sarcosine oxidase, subunit delta
MSSMKWFDVPLVGRRPIDELVYGGPVRRASEGEEVSDAAWADHVFGRRGEPGVRREWWYHRPTASWFLVERDTASDRIERVLSPLAAGKET